MRSIVRRAGVRDSVPARQRDDESPDAVSWFQHGAVIELDNAPVVRDGVLVATGELLDGPLLPLACERFESLLS